MRRILQEQVDLLKQALSAEKDRSQRAEHLLAQSVRDHTKTVPGPFQCRLALPARADYLVLKSGLLRKEMSEWKSLCLNIGLAAAVCALCALCVYRRRSCKKRPGSTRRSCAARAQAANMLLAAATAGLPLRLACETTSVMMRMRRWRRTWRR